MVSAAVDVLVTKPVTVCRIEEFATQAFSDSKFPAETPGGGRGTMPNGTPNPSWGG